ncbi:hypothetical protein GmHk_09G025037 [Glycine max]|nr:hypothetical protein GmHk_09G025037 [Glycine max]
MPLRTLQDEKSNPEKKIGIKVSAFVPQELGTTQHNSEIEEKGTTQIKVRRESATQLVKNPNLAKKSEEKSTPPNRINIHKVKERKQIGEPYRMTNIRTKKNLYHLPNQKPVYKLK